MSQVLEPWSSAWPPETDFRWPDFLGGIPVRLADGQEWAFAGPRELPEAGESVRAEVVALLWEIAESESEPDRCRGELALAIRLLGINYALSSTDYALLFDTESSTTFAAEMRASFHDLARRHAQAMWVREVDPPANLGRRFRFPSFRRLRRDRGIPLWINRVG